MVLALRWRPRGRDRIRLSGYQRYCQWSPITGWSQWSGDRWLWSAWSWPCLERYFSPFCDQQSAFDLGHHRACPFAASNQNHAFGSSRSLDEASKPIQQPSCLSWKSNFISQCNQGINTIPWLLKNFQQLYPKLLYSMHNKQYHSVWKSQRKSHSTLRAKRAMFTFWVDKSSLIVPKISQFQIVKIMRHFGWFQTMWALLIS